MAGQKEFEIELLFNPDMLNDPEKIKEIGNIYPKTPHQYQTGSTISLKQEVPEGKPASAR